MPYIRWQDNNDNVEIYYEVIGHGQPVVLHHGNGNSSDDWYSLGYVDALKNDIQLIMIDARGYGKSSKFYDPTSYPLKSRATDTIKVLDHLGIQKAHILGGSYSASLGFLFAKYYPERVQTLIFATPYFTLITNPEFKDAMLKGPEYYLGKLEGIFGKFHNEAIRKTFLSNDTKALWAANSAEWFDYKEYIKYVTMPCLVYVGSQEQTLNEVTDFANQLPHCEYTIFPDIDHAALYWDGNLVAPVIREFVKSHPIPI